VLARWNDTQTPYPKDAYVHQLFERQAARTPDAVALTFGDKKLTYRELDAKASQLAHHLRSLGVARETIVGIYLERSLELVVGMLGILKAGGACLPLDPTYPKERLAFMLNDGRVPVLVTQQSFVTCLPRGPWRIVALDVEESEIAPESPHSTSGSQPEDLGYVIYTSGSTGWPKGVEITHGSLLNLVFWHQCAFGVTTVDRATQLASPGFDAAFWEVWPYLAAGASVHLPDEAVRVAPEILRDWLVAQKITISFLPTALAESVIALSWPAETALRVLLTGADTLRRYPPPGLPFRVVNNYGPTESTVVATSGAVLPDDRVDLPPSIGRPIANTQTYILDAQVRRVLIGEPGELHIGGAGLARGYLNRPELTAEKFIPNPFSDAPGSRLYKTGDIACYLPDGRISFLGRIDEQIKIRGYRVEPNEIVTVLNRHPTVAASVVVGRGDVSGDKHLVAYVVPVSQSQPTEGALRDFLRISLPEYMVPTVYVRLAELPIGPHGKLDRAALPAPNGANKLRHDGFVAPRTPVEERLAQILAGLLCLEQVGMDDNFFLLGGHSLLATQVINRVRNAFGVELSLRSLFEAPTVAALSSEIEWRIRARLQAMSEDEARRVLDLSASPRPVRDLV
jgi:amino acid adenylation domain-containing protein